MSNQAANLININTLPNESVKSYIGNNLAVKN